jgi:hypothetical protein
LLLKFNSQPSKFKRNIIAFCHLTIIPNYI